MSLIQGEAVIKGRLEFFFQLNNGVGFSNNG